eukprot:scaffold19124_cov148-Skeletonema_menzelii.AAC.1
MTAFTSSLHNKQTQEHVLHQWFANYLRLRDGFVLFESGERRHKHDVDEKTYREFPSRLRSKPKYGDNTRTFSSKLGYTGYGMDEFNDEVVGIRKRLLDQLVIIKGGGESSSSSSSLARENIWNKFMESDAGEIWNMYFDQIVAVTGSLRKDLSSVQSRFVAEINQHVQTHWRQRTCDSIGKLKLVAEDKAERISFGSTLDVCREGNKFTLLDKSGSLPIGMSVMDWKKKFRPTQQQQQQSRRQQPKQNQVNKKRKRILEDSSSDEESDNDDIPSTTAVNGLVVRERREVTTSSGAEANNKKTSSLDEIKRQAGVSATQLEQGFDQLEGEEFKSTMAANEDDVKEGFLAEDNERKCPHLVSA